MHLRAKKENLNARDKVARATGVTIAAGSKNLERPSDPNTLCCRSQYTAAEWALSRWRNEVRHGTAVQSDSRSAIFFPSNRLLCTIWKGASPERVAASLRVPVLSVFF